MPVGVEGLQGAVRILWQAAEHFNEVEGRIDLGRIAIGADQLTGYVVGVVPVDRIGILVFTDEDVLLAAGVAEEVDEVLVLGVRIGGRPARKVEAILAVEQQGGVIALLKIADRVTGRDAAELILAGIVQGSGIVFGDRAGVEHGAGL